MREIPLTQGKVALVDEEDYESLSQFKWCAAKSDRTWYATRNVKDRAKTTGQRRVYMHREIMEAGAGVKVDHQNRNGLDNQRHNLREATHAQNMQNKLPEKRNTSGYKGVWPHNGHWRSGIKVNGQRIHLGVFTDPIEAARAYDEAAIEHFGEFACTNDIGGVVHDR